MNYNVTKVEAKTVQKQGQNFGKKYVECTVMSEQGDVRVVPVFDAEATALLACISTAKGGTAQADQPIPEQLAKWQFCFDQVFTFPEAMVRVDGVTGQPLLNKFGQMYIRTSCTVLTRYQYDEQLQLLNPNGPQLSPRRGWDLASRGTSVMNSFYLPLRNFTASGQAQPGVNPMQGAAQQNGTELPV